VEHGAHVLILHHPPGVAGYDRGGFISKHDDGASHDIDGEPWHRNIALVYYLTPGWQREDGGLFVDFGVTSAPLDPPVEVSHPYRSGPLEPGLLGSFLWHRPGTAVKLLWPAVTRLWPGENLRFKPTQAYLKPALAEPPPVPRKSSQEPWT
jgi:hypothetical protein